jgi:hypothetical protein
MCVYSDAGVDASREEWTASYARSYPSNVELCNMGNNCTVRYDMYQKENVAVE